MTEPKAEGPDSGSVDTMTSASGPTAPDDDGRDLSYQGSKVPFIVVLIWLTFFIWGVIYLLRWIPESWREWFAR